MFDLLLGQYKVYFIIGLLAIVGVTVGIYVWKYHNLQTALQVSEANNTVLKVSLTQEKSAFDTLQSYTNDLLTKMHTLETTQQTIQADNDVLKKKLQSYDYKAKAIVDSKAAELEINQSFATLMKKLEDSTKSVLDVSGSGK